MGWWTLAAGAAGAASGLLGQWAANRANRQLNEQNRQHEFALLGREQQFAAQQAELSDQRTRDLYSDLMSPEALRQQYENAGLSVGMMYGNGGAGGNLQTGAQAESPSAQNRGTIPMQSLVGAETEKIMAETEKNMAEAENIKTDTKNKWKNLDVMDKQMIVMEWSIENTKQNIEQSKKEVEKLGTEILNIMADSKLKENQAELAKAQKEFQEALTRWQDAQTTLANIDAQTRGEFNEIQIKQMKAAMTQSYASAKAMNELAAKYGAERQGQEIQNRINKFTAYDQMKTIMCKRAISEMEAGTFMKGKRLEWNETMKRINKMTAEIEKINWETMTEKQKTQFFNQYDEQFGEGWGGMMRTIVEDLWPNFGAGYVSK